MVELLQFVFSGFWTFAGCALLLTIVCLALEGMVAHIARAIAACRSSTAKGGENA